MEDFATTFFRNMCGKQVFFEKFVRLYVFFGGKWGKKWPILGCFWGVFGVFLGCFATVFNNKFDEVFLCHHFYLISLTKNGLFWGVFGVKSLIFGYFLVFC